MEKVSILKVPSYRENLVPRVAELLKPLGGWESFCKPGDRVLLKPNLVMAKPPESAALTHPALILAVASLLKDLGCRVALGDSPGLGSAESVIRKLGMDRELKRLQVEVVEFETKVAYGRFPATDRFERRFKSLELAGELLEYDRLINMAKLKSHGQMGVTLATKNLFGCVVGHNKGRWHFAAGWDLHAFARLLVEIALTVNASLHILDGITGMDGNGPTSGRPREIGLLLAGTNPIALDRVVVELIGRRPEQFPLFEAAREMGLAGLDLEGVELLGAGIHECLITDFEIPSLVPIRTFVNPVVSGLLERFIRQRLTLDPGKCVNCRKCEQLCPAQAIHYLERIRIDDRKCIRCCCCQELCPVGALTVSEPWGVKIMRRLKLI